jgi:SAM-dependent methyltransferase
VKPPASETYRRDRLSPKERFDEVETTMSHLLRRPHPALGGRSYGGALHSALRDRGFLEQGEVTEIGAGAWFVASAFLEASGGQLRYRLLDLSRPLLRLQRSRMGGEVESICASAERLPFRDGAVRGLVLANEVVADLSTVPAAEPDARALVQRYGLAVPAEKRPLINTGALRLLEELARVLAPGAGACLTEFGGDFSPGGIWLSGSLGRGGHLEHSIHFGHLEAAARALGLEVQRVKVADLLGLDRTVRVASYHDLLRLRRFVPDLPIVAVPRAELEARHPVLTRIFRFEFPPIGSAGFPHPGTRGGFAELFVALLLRKR